MTPDSKGTTNGTGFQYQSPEGKNKSHFYFPMSAEMWNILCDSYQSFSSILEMMNQISELVCGMIRSYWSDL